MATDPATWPPLADVAPAGASLRVRWQDGTVVAIPCLWLRHNCDCPACMVEQTAEKRFQIHAAPPQLRPAGAAIDAREDRLVLDWPDGHRTRYRGAELRELTVRRKPRLRYWDGESMPHRVDFDAFVEDDDAAAGAIAEFLAAGVLVLEAGPTRPGSVERLCRRLGPIREVLFERIHNVALDPAGYNIAHTNEDVPPHNDMVSYSWPPSVQALHMLANDCAGGESGLVDGFAVLRRFRRQHPEMFETLRMVPVPFRQFDADNETFAVQPTVEVDAAGELRLLRFSNQLMQRLPLWEPRLEAFYHAYRELAAAVNSPGARVDFRLAAGEALLTAGHRVLHARRPIVGQGRRHLQDAYFDHDNVRNHLRLLQRQGRVADDWSEATDGAAQTAGVRYPNDPGLKGLAAATSTSDVPNWEFDIRAVPFGEDVVEVSDWHQRKGRARQGRSTRDAAAAGIAPVGERPARDETAP